MFRVVIARKLYSIDDDRTLFIKKISEAKIMKTFVSGNLRTVFKQTSSLCSLAYMMTNPLDPKRYLEQTK